MAAKKGAKKDGKKLLKGKGRPKFKGARKGAPGLAGDSTRGSDR
jgi:hypothetical protein